MLFSLSSVAFIFLESVKHNKNPDTASPEAISGQVQVFTFLYCIPNIAFHLQKVKNKRMLL